MADGPGASFTLGPSSLQVSRRVPSLPAASATQAVGVDLDEDRVGLAEEAGHHASRHRPDRDGGGPTSWRPPTGRQSRRARGWAVPRVFGSLAGEMNTAMLVFEYPDAATYEREDAAE